MTPQGIFDQQIWWILQEIQRERLYLPENDKDKISFPLRTQPKKAGKEIPSFDVQRNLLNKLKEWGAIDKRPDLSEILAEATDTANKNIENNLVPSYKLPPLPKPPTRYSLTIIQPKFDEICEKYQKISDTKRINLYAEGFLRDFSPQNYSFVLMVIGSILSLTDFSPDGEVYYQLQSPAGQDIINERALLKKLSARGLLRHYGEDGINGIVTLSITNKAVLKAIELHLRKSLQQLNAGNAQKIREPSEERAIQSIPDEYKIPVRDRELRVNNYLTEKPHAPPNWELAEENKIPKIKKNGVPVFTFPTNWSDKYRYFKCLWKNYGENKSFKEIYEFESPSKYPEKGVCKTNRNIRGTIIKLRKEFENKNLPIKIETNKGFTLTIQNS